MLQLIKCRDPTINVSLRVDCRGDRTVMTKRRYTPGQRLRATRWALGLTFRDVHLESVKLAQKHRSRRFILPVSRLHDFEVKGMIPSIHRLHTLAHVYGFDLTEIAGWYGIPQERPISNPSMIGLGLVSSQYSHERARWSPSERLQ